MFAEGFAGGNEAADDDVFLKSFEHVHTVGGGGFHKNTNGFLEGSGGKPALRVERDARKTEQKSFVFNDRFALLFKDGIFFHHGLEIHHFSGKKVAGSGFDEANLGEHLARDDFNVLVVDGLSLGSINALHFAHDVLLCGVNIREFHQLAKIQVSAGERSSFGNEVAILHAE